MSFRRALLRLSSLSVVLTIGCGDDTAQHPPDAGARAADSGSCLASLNLDCQLAFEPTYPMIFDHLLLTTCGAPTSGGSCHGPRGAQAGLILSDQTQSYDLLLGHTGNRARVLPNDPECSLIERRLESTDPNFRMPPGNTPLPENVRCAVRKWIANGASDQ